MTIDHQMWDRVVSEARILVPVWVQVPIQIQVEQQIHQQNQVLAGKDWIIVFAFEDINR